MADKIFSQETLNAHAHAHELLTRRRFVGLAGGASAAVLGGGLTLLESGLSAAPTAASPSETLAAQLYNALTGEQRKTVCFPFDHRLRSEIENNWHITKPRIGDFFTPDQQALVREIFLKLHSDEYAGKVLKQVEHDNGRRGFAGCSVAFFGRPGSGKFEFVFTGRHVTRRCDGDSVEGAAFGGPIFYGHAAKSFNEKADHAGNVYWYQAVRANEVFEMLDGKQRKAALLGESRGEQGKKTVELGRSMDQLAGIPVAELTPDQKEHFHQVLADLLAPFRKEDADEVMKCVQKGGVDQLRLSFYQQENIGNDTIWDVWQIEGPHMVWYFRGKPHVHTWVHVREPKA